MFVDMELYSSMYYTIKSSNRCSSFKFKMPKQMSKQVSISEGSTDVCFRLILCYAFA